MKRVGFSGASIAITFSLLGHAGVALVAARHVARRTVVSDAHAAQPEMPPAEFVIDEVTEVRDSPEKEAETAPAANSPVQEPVARAAVARAPSESRDAAPEPAAAPATVTAETNLPHFTMTVAATSGRVGNVGLAASPESARGEPSGAAVIPASIVATRSDDTPAKLRAGTVPAYTPAALSAGVEANVPLEIVVSENGDVTSARPLEHVGYGLDEAAQRSILGYRFTPAMRGGRAVAVRMRWLMRFQLR